MACFLNGYPKTTKMNLLKITTVPLALSVCLLFSSCYKHDHNNVTPTPTYNYTFDDEFDYDRYNWSFSDPANSAYVGIANGELNYSYHPSSYGTNTVAVQAGLNVNSDFMIQTSIISDNTMGLAFGVSNNDYGFAFMIDYQGNYSLYYEGSATQQPQAIIDWQHSSAVKTASNAWNNLEIDQIGNYWYGYINNVQVFKVQAWAFYGSKIGFIVESGTTGYADYLTAGWY